MQEYLFWLKLPPKYKFEKETFEKVGPKSNKGKKLTF